MTIECSIHPTPYHVEPCGTTQTSGTIIGDLPGCTCGPWWGIIPPGPCPYHTPVMRPVYVPVPVIPLPYVVPVVEPILPPDRKELAKKFREMADALDPEGATPQGVKDTIRQLREALDKLEAASK